MRYVLFALGLMLLHLQSFSQDTIVKTNGDEIKAKVLEVDLKTIKFKRFDNLSGPIYTIEKSEVSMIKYENGTTDIIQEEKTEDEVLNETDAEINGSTKVSEYGYNIISFNPLHIAYKNLTFSYEAFSHSQKVGYKVPLMFGLGKIGYLSSGIYFKFYPTTSGGKVKYFVGPYIQLAGDKDYYYTSLQLDNGISFQPAKAFNLSLDFSFGAGWYDHIGEVKYFFKGQHKGYFPYYFGINIGWRF